MGYSNTPTPRHFLNREDTASGAVSFVGSGRATQLMRTSIRGSHPSAGQLVLRWDVSPVCPFHTFIECWRNCAASKGVVGRNRAEYVRGLLAQMTLRTFVRRLCAVLGIAGLLLAGWIAVVNIDSPPLVDVMAFLWVVILVIASAIPLLAWWYLKKYRRSRSGDSRS